MTADTIHAQLARPLIRANDGVFRYLGRWHVGPTAITVTNGAECEFVCTGHTCTLQFDAFGSDIVFPHIAYWLDGQGPTRIPLDASGLVPVLSRGDRALSDSESGRHHVRFMVNIESGYPVQNHNWTTQRDAVRFQGVRLGEGERLTRLPDSSEVIEFLGDSITAGLGLLFTPDRGYSVATAAPELNWTESVSRLLGMRAMVNGHGGQGITAVATDGTPAASSAFPYVFEGALWSPDMEPSVVVVYQGTNDPAFTAQQYRDYLALIRSAYPAARIAAIAPYQRPAHVLPIRAAVEALTDPLICFLDYSSAFDAADTGDGSHFNLGGASRMSHRLAGDIRERMI